MTKWPSQRAAAREHGRARERQKGPGREKKQGIGKKMLNSWNELSYLLQTKEVAIFVYTKRTAF
jgi:hypothetical protein